MVRTDPDGGTLTNTYNASGQVSGQVDPSGRTAAITYTGTPTTSAGGSTTVTLYPAGTGMGAPTQVTQFAYRYGELFATTVNPGASNASTTVLQRSAITGQVNLSEDPNGNASTTSLPVPTAGSAGYLNTVDPSSSLDGLGNQSLFAYTSFNEPWCQVEPAEVANGVTCPTTQPTAAPTPGSLNTVDLGATITYYDGAGNPTYVTDPLGNTTQTAYTTAEQPWCEVSAEQFTVAGKSCPSTPPSSPPTGTVTGYTTTLYSSSGNITSVTDPMGDTTTSVYANSSFPSLVTQQTDPVGDVTTNTYDAAGHKTQSVETFGSYSATSVTAYDSAGRSYCGIGALAYSQGHTTCPSPPTTAPTPGSDPWPGDTITIYDDDRQPLYQVNPAGGVTESAYDGTGQVYCSVTPANFAAGTTCPTSPPTTAPTGTLTGYTTTIYDALGRIQSVTNPLGGTTASSYDPAGNVVQTTVESNNTTSAPNIVTQNTYDADSQLISSTVGAGSAAPATTLTSYDPDGNAYCSVSANAYAAGGSTYQCPQWQSSWVGAPPSPTSLYSTTPTAAQANNVTTTFFDANGHQIQSTNPDVQTTISAVDADANTYCSSDATNVATWLTAHPSGTYPYLCPGAPPTSPPAQGSNPGYVTTIFDAAGRTVSSTDQVGDTTTYTYDAAANVLTTTDPRGKVTANCYYWQNTTGSCAHSAPAGGGAASAEYSSTTPATSADPSGELTTTTYFPGTVIDATTNPAETATNAYDAMGELTSVTHSGNASGYSTPANLAYSFNSDGTRHTMTDASGTTTYGYDAAGDVTSQALVASGGLANATTSFGYFDTGVLSDIIYPAYGSYPTPTVNYSYDATGAMTSEADWLSNQVTFAHDASGNQTTQANAVSLSIPAGTSSTSVSYDAADNATTSTSTLAQTCGGSETLTQSFSGSGGSRNPDGQVTADSQSYTGSCSGQGSYQRNYSYDPAGRVVYQGSVPQGASPNMFAYDPSGDPTTISSHASSGPLNTYTQAFDAAGEVTSQTPVGGSGGSTSTYSYDTLGDQTSATSGTTTSTYGFDAAGHMTGATTPAAGTSYLYNGNGLEAGATTTTPHWTNTHLDGAVALAAVSCPSTSFCAAVDGTGKATTYNGTTWSAPATIDGTKALKAVSCPSSSFCAAVDGSGNAVTYNGTTWATPGSIDGTKALASVSCPTSSFCAAVDTSGKVVIYNGSTWATPATIDGTKALKSISCPTSTFCAAVDGSGNVVTYNGTTWASPRSIDGTKVISSVSCTSSSFCMATDTSGNALSYNGTTWSSASSIDGTKALNALSCTSTSFCLAVDASGNALTYNGTTWSSPSSIDGTTSLNGVSCASSSWCVAVDANGNGLGFNGTTWQLTHLDGAVALAAVSCPSTSFCAAVDGTGKATTYNGTTWSAPATIDGTKALKAVSCPSSSFCAAVDGSGNAVTYNGTTWATPGSIDGTKALASVSCPTSSFCAAVDTSGKVVIYNGSTWATPATIDGTKALKSISCPTSTFCAAVDGSGNVVTYNGTTWASPRSIDGTKVISSVSCTSSSFCMATDTSGNALSYNGTTWSSASSIDGTKALNALSCTSTSFCLAVDASGNALTYNGTTWSSPSSIDGTTSLNGVSCASSSWCVAVDANGNGLGFTSTTSLSQITWDANSSLPVVVSDGTSDYLYGPSSTPVEQISLASSTPSYMTYTPSDSSWLTTNEAGDETGFWRYDAFGTLAYGTPTSSFGYAGQYTDTSSGLSNMRARWFEPQTGAFTTRDPAFANTDTAYTYAGGDPTNQSDPTGLRGSCDNSCQVLAWLNDSKTHVGKRWAPTGGPCGWILDSFMVSREYVVSNTDNGIESSTYSRAWASLGRIPGFTGEVFKLNSRQNSQQCSAANLPLSGIVCTVYPAEVYLRKVNARIEGGSTGLRFIQSFFEIDVGGSLFEEGINQEPIDPLRDAFLSGEDVTDMANQFYDFLGSAADAFSRSPSPEINEGTFQLSLGYKYA